MTTTAAERIALHCFKCRTRTEYERLPMARPVYRCLGGCGGTREVEELGREGMQGRIEPAPKKRAPAQPAKKEKPHWLTPERRFAVLESRIKTKETTVKKSPLIQAIEKIVDEKLAEQPAAAGLTREEVVEIVQGEIAKQLGVEVEETNGTETEGEPSPTGGPGRKRTQAEKEKHGTIVSPECRHKNIMRKCESCQARRGA